jgi:starch synthase (maltosyl-transferring)
VYGIYSGFELCENAALPDREEYQDSEKYEIRVRDWNAAGNIKAEITRINAIRRANPALHTWRNVLFHRASDDNVLFFSKTRGPNTLLVAVNLDPFAPAETTLHLPLSEFGYGPTDSIACEELLSGERALWHGREQRLRLDPQRNPAAIFRLDSRSHVAYASPSD